jgi:hypothetical protein
MRERLRVEASSIARRLIQPRLENVRAEMSPKALLGAWDSGGRLRTDEAIELALRG